MQHMKEYLAWGGVDMEQLRGSADGSQSLSSLPWPVHASVVDVVLAGYLRGWGLTGDIVDLDVGTAIFARRRNVRRWNHNCLR